MSSIETVCFDLDNTLCVPRLDDDEIHGRLFDRVAVDPRFTPADVRALDPATLPEADSPQEFYEQMYGALAPSYTAEQLDGLARATDDIVDETDVVFREGAREALDYARETVDQVGMLTQGVRETQHGKLDALGIRDAFDAVVVCGGTDLPGKGSSVPFERVLADLDASAEMALYVGDSLRGDVAGANGVGMQSAWVRLPDTPQAANLGPDDPEPTYVLDSPGDLPNLL